jgi:biotin carboxyl carrier protein
MNEPIMLVRVQRSDAGRVEVLSPGVGWWSDHPHPGALVGPGSRVGLFSVLNHRVALVLPDGAAGRTTGTLPKDLAVAVAYGQVLFELAPVQEGGEEALTSDAGAIGHPAGADLPEGSWAVVSPTDGVFYRRPSPDDPPFIEVGSRVKSGQPIGLVEIMKTFNQIRYGDPGFPDEAEVIEIRVGDAEEIQAGQVLIVVR